MITIEEMQAALRKAGWATWYNENYWVHEKTIAEPKAQDYTNYGMPLERAYEFETTGERPFPRAPFGGILGPGSGVRPLPRHAVEGVLP